VRQHGRDGSRFETLGDCARGPAASKVRTLQTIIYFSAANPGKVCQPRKDGHRYHPVVLPKNAIESSAVQRPLI